MERVGEFRNLRDRGVRIFVSIYVCEIERIGIEVRLRYISEVVEVRYEYEPGIRTVRSVERRRCEEEC